MHADLAKDTYKPQEAPVASAAAVKGVTAAA